MTRFWVYITGSQAGSLHVGIARDLERRLPPHRGASRLLYAERTPDVFAAISRAKQLRGWPRSRRVLLIQQNNPAWRDRAPSRRLTARSRVHPPDPPA